jgi:serine/threonine protein kinase
MENQALLDKYEVELDAAGMPVELRRHATGVTCKGHEIESGREVAVEFVPVRSLDLETRKKIEADAIAAQQINHVNIPKLYDFAFEGKDLVYVTEYFDGKTAESWVTTHGPMPVRAVLHVALQVVSALGAATFQLVMHRAIHPGNLLIVSGQTTEGDAPLIKVLHFGRADPKIFSSGKKSNGIDKAAPFASPEQLENGTVDFRSEIYSLGCTLWSLLTGVAPFNAPGKALAGAQMAAAMKRFRGVPRKIRRLVTQMAATNPDDRPLDPVVMTQQLQDCLVSIERREAIARKLGIPATWQRRRVAKPVGPLALRPLAMAAALVAAALVAFAVANRSTVNSLWKKLSDRGQIGVPIGVSETQSESSKTNAATPAGNSDTATAAKEADLLANLNATNGSTGNTPSGPPSNTPIATSPSPAVASANQDTQRPSPQPAPNESGEQSDASSPPSIPEVAAGSQHSLPAQESTKAVGSPSPEAEPSAAALVVVEATPDPAATKTTESATVADSAALTPNKIPRAELVEGPPPKSASDSADKSNQSAVPRAELVEPPSPSEGSEGSTPGSLVTKKDTAPSTEKMENVPRAELIEPPPAKASREERGPSSYAPSKSERTAIKNALRRANRPRIWADGDGAMVQTPAGMVHARLVGTTRDGQWMLALPSRKIMIVPPPPDFVPR